MEPHQVGDRLVLRDAAGPYAAGRIEAVRPDGSRVERDWEKPPWRLKLDQPGTWLWRLFIRDDGRTHVEEGQIEVIPSTRRRGRLARIWRGGP